MAPGAQFMHYNRLLFLHSIALPETEHDNLPDIIEIENNHFEEILEVVNSTTENTLNFDLFETMISKRRCIPTPTLPPHQIENSGWTKSPTEKFMSRLWAFKRINYLLEENKGLSNMQYLQPYSYHSFSKKILEGSNKKFWRDFLEKSYPRIYQAEKYDE